jgi:alkylation response protein AidB-like acyl-CoA dehydrogenase
MGSYYPTADQRLLRDEVRRVLSAEHPFQPRRGRAAQDDIWAEAAELGWPAALLPESAGGIGGLAEAALLAEEFGRALRPEPLDLIAAIAHAALGATDEPAATALAAEILEGRARPALSPEVCVEAAPYSDGWRLSGKSDLIWGATGANEVLVAARGPQGPLVARVPLEAAGVNFAAAPGFDGRLTAQLELSETAVAGDAIIRDAEAFLDSVRAAYLVLASATAIGAMGRATELSAEYIKTRKQFGVELASFQALQHHLADAHVEIELARSMVALGVETLLDTTDARSHARIASAVKARVGEAALAVGARAIQLHGGVGVTEEFEVGHHYRRLLAFELTAGSRAHHLQRYAELGG